MPNKILIVDDEPFNLDLLEQELDEQNYTIERANDGAEALTKFRLPAGPHSPRLHDAQDERPGSAQAPQRRCPVQA